MVALDSKASQAQAVRDRPRDARLKFDPEQLARRQRIDEAGAAIKRFLEENLAAKNVVRLTGLDQAMVRRLRQIEVSGDDSGSADETAGVQEA